MFGGSDGEGASPEVVAALQAEVETLQTTVARLETRLASLDTDVAKAGKRVATLEKKPAQADRRSGARAEAPRRHQPGRGAREEARRPGDRGALRRASPADDEDRAGVAVVGPRRDGAAAVGAGSVPVARPDPLIPDQGRRREPRSRGKAPPRAAATRTRSRESRGRVLASARPALSLVSARPEPSVGDRPPTDTAGSAPIQGVIERHETRHPLLATNFAILIVLAITANLLEGFLASQGIVFQNSSLLIFAAVFGMGGSFISLAMSKWIAKRATGAQVIDQPRNDTEAWLLQTVATRPRPRASGCPRWRSSVRRPERLRHRRPQGQGARRRQHRAAPAHGPRRSRSGCSDTR